MPRDRRVLRLVDGMRRECPMCCYDSGRWSGRSPITEPCPRCTAPGYIDPFRGLIPIRSVQRYRGMTSGVLCVRPNTGGQCVIVWQDGQTDVVEYDDARNRWVYPVSRGVICWIVGRKIGPMRRVLAQARDAQASR